MNAALVSALRDCITLLTALQVSPHHRRDVVEAAEAALAEAQKHTEPVAALMRSRYVTTWASAAADGKTHYSEWSNWMPTTYKHAKAVTDPIRNTDPLLYEMVPLYAAATGAQP